MLIHWQPCFVKFSPTWQGQHGLKVSTLRYPRTVLSTGMPQILILTCRNDHTARNRRNLPVVISQRNSSDHPAGHTHDESSHFQRCRHFYPQVFTQSEQQRRVILYYYAWIQTQKTWLNDEAVVQWCYHFSCYLSLSYLSVKQQDFNLCRGS